MDIFLEKETDNEYDKEAIQVKLEGLGKIGYVANSPYTVLGESMSAGRIYDKIDTHAKGKIVLVTECGVLCKLNKKSLKKKRRTNMEANMLGHGEYLMDMQEMEIG